MIRGALAQRAAAMLERDGPRSLPLRAASELWAHVANPVRPVVLPADCRIIGVGGATLGGSYKTPLALALARALAVGGHAVAVVSHGYGARVRAPRRVTASDDVRDAGDDAVFLARELRDVGVPVFGGTREGALSLAASCTRIVIVDGLLQARPRRVAWSILAADSANPWGSGACPPAGDLRASPRALVSAADCMAVIHDVRLSVAAVSTPKPTFADVALRFTVGGEIDGAADDSGRVVPFHALARSRVGLLAAIARLERVRSALAARGVRLVETRSFGDHARLPERCAALRRRSSVDVWVTTKKCKTKLGAMFEGKEVLTLEHRLAVPPALVDAAAGVTS